MNTKNTTNHSVCNLNNKGFTLIELLFATIILGVMLTMAITTFIGVFRFYNWAGTTRVNQQNSRQIMDDISRLISSRTVNVGASTPNPNGTYSSLCLIGEGQETIKISLSFFGLLTNKVTVDRYPAGVNDCTGLPNSTREISDNINTKVTKLEFDIVYGAKNNALYLNSDPSLKRSVEFTIDVINGTPSAGTGNCETGDNFCDKASYATAVSER